MDGLEAIVPPSTATVQWKGRAHEVFPLKIGQLPAFARAIKPLADRIGAIVGKREPLTPALVLDLLGDHGESMIEAAAIASGIPRAEVEQADAAELLALVPAVINANRDFLVGRLMPAMQVAADKLQT